MKRFIDFTVALAALILLAPLMLALAIQVRRRLGSPVIFSQPRPGLHGRVFTMHKFRSMRNVSDAQGRPLPDELRLGDFGRWLRGTSLDELPELWNVLKGDMSLVGPRPLLMEYLPLYTPYQARRHEVRPGITGWAQVNGRNSLNWEERFDLDIWYVDHRSLWLDLRILGRTIGRVLSREGVSAPGEATMPRFTGRSGVP